MRLAVLGCGAVGSAVIRLALAKKVAGEVVGFDRDPERAKLYLPAEEGLDVPVEQADALKVEELAGKLKGFDYVVNALPTFAITGSREVPLNPIVMSAALKAGASYVDMACYGGRRTRAEQLAFSRQFRDAGLLAVINFGASPGLSNVLAREVWEDLDRVERIRIVSVEDQRGSTFVIPWSREEMLMSASPVLAYRGGRYVWLEPFEETTVVELPEPIGTLRCYTVLNDECYTIPRFLRTRNFDYYAGGSDVEVLRALYRLGILSSEPVRIGKVLVRPKDLLYRVLPPSPRPSDVLRVCREGELEDAYFAIEVTAEGEAGGEPAESKRFVFFPSQTRVNEILPGTTYITYPTALCVVALLHSVKGRRLQGVMPGEALPRYIRRSLISFLEENRIMVGEEFKPLGG
ncbi:MAG: saccharopine dehydrogenase NADP-binding domain-containing protein [Thermofilaceae archaeon]